MKCIMISSIPVNILTAGFNTLIKAQHLHQLRESPFAFGFIHHFNHRLVSDPKSSNRLFEVKDVPVGSPDERVIPARVDNLPEKTS